MRRRRDDLQSIAKDARALAKRLGAVPADLRRPRGLTLVPPVESLLLLEALHFEDLARMVNEEVEAQ